MLFDKKPLCAYFLDLDECTTGSHSCDVNSVCQNTVGSYKCSCNAGYTGDGKSCNGIYDTVDPPFATTSPKRPISRHGATHIVTLKLHTINCFSKRRPTLIWGFLNKTTKPLKVQCLCAKAQHCHVILEKSLKPYLLKHKNNKQTRTKKMDTFTLATKCKPSGRFNISYSNALRNLQFSCRYRRVFYQLSQLWR